MGSSFEDLEVWKKLAGYQYVFINY